MGKIVKYCATCEESFAEKFGFCPNCGQPMTAFEMNPLTGTAPVADAPIVEEEKKTSAIDEPLFKTDEPVYRTSEPTSFRFAQPIETAPVAEAVSVSANQTDAFSGDEITGDVSKDEIAEEIKAESLPPETKTFAAAASTASNNNFYQTANTDYQKINRKAASADDAFHVTVIEEKNGKQRNALLLGSMALMLTLALGSTVYSLFNKDFGIGAIGDESLFAAVIVEEAPVEVEDEAPKPKDKDDGGGGGGGGREEPEPASKGRLVSQSEKPIFPPNAKLPQLTNPEIKIIQETQGNIKRPITEERAGLPGSDNLNPSNGTGRGGGIGSGNGTGIGGGNGTGEGNGNGSGSGNGNGNGNGNGTGDGSGTRPPPPPPVRVEVVTVPFKIISKPRPTYTDAARQNQVTGVVRLKVTFLASGAIGSIAPVSGLPYGLTEQAISAARQIKFEPQKKNGSAVAVTKTIEYSFTIY